MIRKALFILTLLLAIGGSAEARVRVKLTREMYNNSNYYYFSFDLCNAVDNIYGDPNVAADHYADLSAYESLVVEVAEGKPRFVFNRVGEDALTATNSIEIPNNDNYTEACQKVYDLEDGKKAYVIDLKKIMNTNGEWEKGSVHLNVIKGAHGQKVIVTRMYLLKPENFASIVDDDESGLHEIRVTPRYTIGSKYLKLEELSSAEHGFAIFDGEKVLCINDDTTHIDQREKTRVYPNVKDSQQQIAWRFKIEPGNANEFKEFSGDNYKFHHFDAYTDTFSVLGYACASPYKHLWMTWNKDEPEATNYYDGKENCLNGTNWIVGLEGKRGQITKDYAVATNAGGYYLVSSETSVMAHCIENDGSVKDHVYADNMKQVVDDASAYRYFTLEYYDEYEGETRGRIRVHNAAGTYKSGWTGQYLNVGNTSYVFVGSSLDASTRLTKDDIANAITNKTVLTIRIGDNYLYGSNNQNTAMGSASTAKASTNAVVGFRLEKANNDGEYLFRAVTPSGGDYSISGWNKGSAYYLNSQDYKSNSANNQTFILGLGDLYGQDMGGGAVWKFEWDDDGKLYIKNWGSDAYFNGTTVTSTKVACSLVTYNNNPDHGADLDFGSLWTLKGNGNGGFALYNNALRNGKHYYLGLDGNISETPVYWECYDPSNFYCSDDVVADAYTFRNVGVWQNNFNVDYQGNGVWTHNNTYGEGGLEYGYLKHIEVETEKDGSFKISREGWRSTKDDATRWSFKEVERTAESIREDQLIDDMVFALRHKIDNTFNRYQCYDDGGQPSLTAAFQAYVENCRNYMYGNKGERGSIDVYTLADQLEYYNARLRLVKPKVGDFIEMQGEKNKSYFSGSSSSTSYPMTTEEGASTIFYYDGSKLTNYSSGLEFGNSTDGSFTIGTQLMEESDKVASAILFTDSRVSRFKDQKIPVPHTYSVYAGPTENDKVLIAKSAGTSAHAYNMGFPTEGDAGNYDDETEILLTKVTDLPISVKKSGYSSFFCPQDAQIITPGAKVYVAKVNEEKSSVVFTELTDGKIPANTPVLVEYLGATETVVVTARVRTSGDSYPAYTGTNDMAGKYYTVSYKRSSEDATYDAVLEKQNLNTQHVYTLSNGVFKYFVGKSIPGFKAYLKLHDYDESNHVKAYSFFFDEDEADEEESTGIAEALGIQAPEGSVYNLSGQRVDATRKGVYIVNGRKVFVK